MNVRPALDATGDLHISTGKKEGDELLCSVETVYTKVVSYHIIYNMSYIYTTQYMLRYNS